MASSPLISDLHLKNIKLNLIHLFQHLNYPPTLRCADNLRLLLFTDFCWGHISQEIIFRLIQRILSAVGLWGDKHTTWQEIWKYGGHQMKSCESFFNNKNASKCIIYLKRTSESFIALRMFLFLFLIWTWYFMILCPHPKRYNIPFQLYFLTIWITWNKH